MVISNIVHVPLCMNWQMAKAAFYLPCKCLFQQGVLTNQTIYGQLSRQSDGDNTSLSSGLSHEASLFPYAPSMIRGKNNLDAPG